MMADKFNKKRPSLPLTKIIGALIWRMVSVYSFIMKKTPVITKETVNTISKKYFYNNSKVIESGFKFRPIAETISRCCRVYLDQK